MGGAYALNLFFLRASAQDLGIETDLEFYEKLRVLEDEILTIWEEKRKDGICDAKQKARCEAQHGEFIEWACSECEKNKKSEDKGG